MEKVKLNIVPKGKKTTCYASQNDNGRVVRFELFNELIPYILDGSETISIKVVRPDSEEILASIENTFEGEAYIDVVFNANMTEIAGVGECEITITDGETVLGSRNFDMNIEIDAYNGRDVIIETSTGTLAEFDTEVEDNALEYESEIPYKADGYTGLRVINTRTAPVYDKTPYLFRKTPSGYGNSCIEKLNGLTVAFNQLVVNGNFTDTSGWESNNIAYGAISANNNQLEMSIVDTPPNTYTPFVRHSPFTVLANRKYFIGFDFLSPYLTSVRVETQGGLGITIPLSKTNSFERLGAIYTRPTDSINSVLNFYPQYSSGNWSTGDKWYIKNVICIDLTQMFGSTIADYIDSLETAQAGAGVAYFKALFGADYYEYNDGELMSVKTSGRKTVGKNLITDPEFSPSTPSMVLDFGEDKTFNNIVLSFTALNSSAGATNAAVIDYRKSDGSHQYKTLSLFQNENGVSYSTPNTVYNGRFRIAESNISFRYVYIYYLSGSWSAFTSNSLSDFQLEIGSQATAYEPYSEITYPLDPDLELRGIPKLDANNKLYGDGDIYESSGDVTRRYGIVDLGSLNWGKGFGGFYSAGLQDIIKITDSAIIPNMLIKNYVTMDYLHASDNDKTVSQIHGGSGYAYNGYVVIYDSAYNDAAAFKTAMNGVYLIYELETPTTESADPFTDPQEARVTEEFIDNRAIPIPVGQDSIYGTDIEYQDIDFDTTIYGGEIDAVNGVLSSEYNSDGSVKPTPEIIDIAPTPIPVKAGDNKIFNNANGNQTIRYYNQVEE